MSRQKILALACLLLCAALAHTQSSSQQNSASPQNQPQQPQNLRRGNWTPCWQQAGIQKSVMEQRWALERETRSQVEAVCSNSSLTPQQKREQVREIRQQGRQKMEGLVTPEQEKALTACQQEHGMGHPGGGMHEGMGGCGEWQGGPHPGAPAGGAGSGNGAGSGSGAGSANGSGNPPPPSHE